MNNLEGTKLNLCKYISTYPVISRSKERWEFAKPKERMNRNLIINSNLRVVWKIVDSTINMSDNLTQNDFMDLFNSGIIGLNKAIDKFDPKFNVRFYTYSYYWIKSYVIKERDKKVIKHPTQNTLYIEELNEANNSNCPYKSPKSAQYEENIVNDINTNDIIEAVNDILESDEHKQIFKLYFVNGRTGIQVGAIMGLSIRQIYIRIGKIRDCIKNNLTLEQMKQIIN